MIAWFLLGSAIAYGVVIIVYRLHIHPLSRFPGPRLAALTGLYEVVCTVWGSGSFDDEIDRLHRIYGPIVRITPDEIHVREQFSSPDADCWISGTEVLDAGRGRSGEGSQSFQVRKRSIWQVRSILKVEVHYIIRGLVRRHQVQREFSSRGRNFISIAELRGTRADQSEESDLEDGSPRVSLLARGWPMSRSYQKRKDQLPPPACQVTQVRGAGRRKHDFSGQALYSTMQGMGGQTLPF